VARKPLDSTIADPPAVLPKVAPSLLVIRLSCASAAASPRFAQAIACAASTEPPSGSQSSLLSAGPAKGSSCESSDSSSASPMKRAMPASERSEVEVVATCLPRITRSPAECVPASSTSSGSPSRTLAESSPPVRRTHSATVAPFLIAVATI
jgi:hypothetical protein